MLDANRDGELVFEELQAGFLSGSRLEAEKAHGLNASLAALKLSNDKVADIIQRGDQDSSGTLTFEELLSATPSNSTAALTQEASQLKLRLHRCMVNEQVWRNVVNDCSRQAWSNLGNCGPRNCKAWPQVAIGSATGAGRTFLSRHR